MSNHTAVITGSTAGLGAAFARQLAAQGYNLVLVARDGKRLRMQAESMSSQYGVRTSVIVADLVTDDGVAAVQERLADRTNPVHLLVNNAGHGLATDFIDSDLDDERKLLRLHVQTTMELSHTAANAMVRRRGGRIINVASTAGYISTGTYSAAKSWVINFSKGLHSQLRSRGVTVTALVPGLVRTEFHQRSGIKIKSVKRWMWLDADDVVRQALTANAQGASTCVPARSYQMLTAGLRFMPDSVVQWAVDKRTGSPENGEDSEGETAGASDFRAANRDSSVSAEYGTGDGTAEPTTDAIKTVNAYKSAKAKSSAKGSANRESQPPKE
ncbi:SDR family oxidoreductase [Nesterenkonia sp. YGD6]|uniref:SDR family NAD(P)-dependent oxidoreductase n=1 Tax=Nesterenkonia sp. YGD6 TaxID=2901231 RepID=UPI001F4CC32B|nr:SDR family oxidoreductase [Nesterenkonia sp. YGD6]MCH8562250.1 SDR family oxidoreductase [Nesterenkonia sp. YGD6]